LRVHIIKYLIIIFFSGYYSSISFFPHSHIIDGIKVTHSHIYNPFNQEEIPDHQHTQNEILVIDMLSHFVTTTIIVLISFGIVVFFHVKTPIKKNHEFVSKFFFVCSNGLRAPPLNFHN
jgi:hypothetical protein